MICSTGVRKDTAPKLYPLPPRAALHKQEKMPLLFLGLFFLLKAQDGQGTPYTCFSYRRKPQGYIRDP